MSFRMYSGSQIESKIRLHREVLELGKDEEVEMVGNNLKVLIKGAGELASGVAQGATYRRQ